MSRLPSGIPSYTGAKSGCFIERHSLPAAMLPPVSPASIRIIASDRPQIVRFRCIAFETVQGTLGTNSLTTAMRRKSQQSRMLCLTRK